MSDFNGLGRRTNRPSPWRQGIRRIAFAISTVALLASAAAPVAAVSGTSGADAERVKVIVSFDGAPGKAAERTIEERGGSVHAHLKLINGIAAELSRGEMKHLAGDAGVRRVELDPTLTAIDPAPAAVTETGDLEYDNAWGVSRIGAPAVHAAGIKGAGVRVAIIDTGIDYIHDDPDDTPYVVDPEFNGTYAGGWDWVNNDNDPYDDMGHGTHVAGILAADHNGYLVAGVAPEVDLFALKILDANGEGDVSNLILALQWSLDNNIDVVNMSLGTHEVSPALATAVTNAAAQGLLMVAASGNVNPFDWQELFFGCPVAFPGAYPEVLSTTFTNPNDALTGYSCTGPEVDFAAPGDAVFSPVPIGACPLCKPWGYDALSGTSMASPHLAGTVALLLSAGITDAGAPGLFDDVKAQLCATADTAFGVNSTPIAKTDPRYPLYFGCGVVDAAAAVLGLNPPPANTPPVATADDINVVEDTPANLAVLANDSDADGDALTVTSATDSPHGQTSVNANGTIHYIPDANFFGDDWFDYTISDGHGGSASTSVKVRVIAAPDAPNAVNDTATTAEDTPVDITVLANDTDADGDALSVTGVAAAIKGTPTINANGTIHFVPSANAVGDAYFEYTVSDGHGGTDTANVYVSLTFVNDAPVAVNDSATTAIGTPVVISVLANDTDIEGTALAVAGVSDPPHGTAVANADGTVTYTPDAGYSGPDAFGYTATDGSASSNIATVSITVSGSPPPPNPIHVGDLDGSASSTGKTWTAHVTIRVHTAAETAVAGAVVSGTWSNGASGTATCTTTASGTCSVQHTKLTKTTVPSATFTVTGVTLAGATYTPASNHDPDIDSNGTSITVARPA